MIVLDVKERYGRAVTGQEDFLTWLREHGVTPEDTYKLEVDEDRGSMVVYQYAKNSSGKKYTEEIVCEKCKHRTADVVRKDPFQLDMIRPFAFPANADDLPAPEEHGGVSPELAEEAAS
jgi:hypothetical protein